MSDDYFLRPNIGVDVRSGHLGGFTDRAGFERFAAAYNDGMAKLPQPAEVRAIDTAFGPVRGYRFGDRGGTPIVLLSGRQASTPMWRANIPSMLAHHDVWCIDSIGEPGASTQLRPITSPQNQAAWVHEAISALPVERVHLIGVSIGGWLVAQCAIHRPGRLASAILLDPAVTFAPYSWKMVVVSLGSIIPGMPGWLRHQLLSWISGGVRSDDELPEGRLIASGMRDFVQHQPVPARPTADELGAISVPMLVILAGSSIAHNAHKAAEAARRVPGAQVEVWDGASHAINGERPDDISDRVASFLASLPNTH